MTRDEMTKEAYDKLILAIGDLLMTQGLKATTMDSIAASLQMSKRTLYEIFSSKNEMIISALIASHEHYEKILKEIFDSSSNVMEGIYRAFLYQRDEMEKAHVDFFRDMDTLFSEAREYSQNHKKKMMEDFHKIYLQGVKQGLFRKNVNFPLLCRLLWIQMESLKRMEEVFPPDITLLEAYDTICMGFLRGIATPRGLSLLDNLADAAETQNNQLPNN